MIRDRLLAWSPAILLLLLAILTWWLDARVRSPQNLTDADARGAPDFYIEGFNAVRMNPDGTRRYELTGKRLVHYADESSSILSSPTLLYHDYERAPVTVSANTAELESGGENVYFRGDVRLERPPFDVTPRLGVATSYLHVIPDQEIAKTDQAVTMADGNSTVRSVGLEFDNRTRRIKLLSRVQAHYENPRAETSETKSLPGQ
jgi:lipopolysaccharide export system protein LptC